MMLLELLLGSKAPAGSQLFTSSGSFVVPNGIGYISVAGVGAGGAGGGSTASYAGVGGAGGALVYGNNIPVTPGETLTIEIGTGGTSSVGANGTSGGYTEIRRGATTLLRANGGAGGSYVNTIYAGLTTAATSANIGGYTYNQAGGNGGGAGYANWEGSGGGGAGGYSGAGGTGGTEQFSYSTGDINYPSSWQERMLASYGLDLYYCDGPNIRKTYDFSTFTTETTLGGSNTFLYIMRNYISGAPLIAVGTAGNLRYYNGSTWTAPSTGTSENIFGIVDTSAGSGTVWGACGNGTVLYNTTASNYNSWATYGPGSTGTSEILLGNVRLFDATYSNVILNVGANGTILLMRTYPSIAFVLCTSGTTENLFACAYNSNTGSGTAIVGGTNGTILRSTQSSNYTTWTTQTSGTSSSLYRGTYYNGAFYFIGANGTIIKSTDDGVTWTTVTTGVISDLLWGILPPVNFVGDPIYGVLYNKDVFPMSGNTGRWVNSKINFNTTGTNGSGGGGGGGAGAYVVRGGGGGGVAVAGTGTSGTGGVFTAGNAAGGGGGSSGSTGTAGTSASSGGLGGNYGAGGGGASKGGTGYAGASGASGALKILWGSNGATPQSFPTGS